MDVATLERFEVELEVYLHRFDDCFYENIGMKILGHSILLTVVRHPVFTILRNVASLEAEERPFAESYRPE